MTERERVQRAYRRELARRRRKKQRREKRTILGIICFFVMIFCSNGAIASNRLPQIRLKVKSVEMMQDDALPDYEIEVRLNNQKTGKRILDFSSGYTVDDLKKDLKKKKYIQISCDADRSVDGEYPITLKLDDDFEKTIQNKWHNRVVVTTVDSTLTVKNKLGTWKGKQFEKYDGTLLCSDFLNSHNHTYYFDENGNMVTGAQTINNTGYYFDENGVMQTGWRKTKDASYHYADDGKMTTGWLELDGDKYYFDADGKMFTGEQQIGTQKCVFADDGKLKSVEDKLDKNKPMMALTFDDGPGERTMELLNVLEQYDAHATFFMQGINAAKYQDEIRKMTEIGCELGNHSYNHPSLATLDAAGVASQVNQTNDIIKQADGKNTATVMRPPYGAINDTVSANVGMPMILWSIDTLDWKTKNAQATIDTVMNTAGDGDVVLMHDIHSTSVDAAIQLIPKLIEKGYQLVTVSEMANARGYTLEAGKRYSQFYKQ